MSAILPVAYFRSQGKIAIESIYRGIFWSTLLLMFYVTINFDINTGTRAKGFESGSISPLALSYTSIIGLGLGIGNLFLNKGNKLLNITLILISIPVFFYGASKGSVVALLISMIPIFTIAKVKLKYKLFAVVFFIITAFGMFKQYEDSALIQRITISTEKLNSQEKEARVLLWEKAIENFQNSPFFGDFIEVRGVAYMGNKSFYPHNVILEAFMSLGLFGGILFVILLGIGIKLALGILRLGRDYYWAPMLYFQALGQHMFSGSIWGGLWLWASLAIVIAVNNFHQREK